MKKKRKTERNSTRKPFITYEFEGAGIAIYRTMNFTEIG